MRHSRRDQLALALFALVCAFLAWRAHERGLFRRSSGPDPVASSADESPSKASTAASVGSARTVPVKPRWVSVVGLPKGAAPSRQDATMTNRLRNTDASVDVLMRNEHALLLRNALIDTANGEPLEIPASLRSSGPSEAWVVQAEGPITPGFRAELAAAGASIVSYVPNNALLVRASPDAAERLAVAGGVAAILPLEPYFKLTPRLLNLALHEEPLPEGVQLILTVAADSGEPSDLAALGARVIGRERGPFGTLLTVDVPRDSLVAIAGMPSVHRIEPRRTVGLANDLTAYALGSTTVPENTDSFDGLDGSKVLVNVNDTGVDAGQPDLTNRVYTIPNEPQILTDPSGHGTHVAGIIAGDGSQSGTINQSPDGPPQGSVTNASFKGKAPKASLFVLPIDLLYGPAAGDSFLQETAAQAPERFNSEEEVLISNNSWGYIGFDEFEYSTHSASYDAAVRDALPGKTGDQPILYVFSAGNQGFGGNNGVGGFPDSVVSPGNAKNVVTVGALESLRAFTNAIIYDTNAEPVQIGGLVIKPGWQTNEGPYFTNQALLPLSDTDWQVAYYSSRGNVGIGVEGVDGRFKPDVVAGGSFVISTRSQQWSPDPLPPSDSPFFPTAVLFDEINARVLPDYRYELGTSMSAPAISGFLAQLQQYFEQRVNQFPSAAAYKALLINSAHPTSPDYVPIPGVSINYAGWGLPNLQRALGRGFRAVVNGTETDVIGMDSSGGVATGESVDLELNIVSTNAANQPLRLALVWTDPPGDPLVGPKLVNDLNLVVSNRATGEIYWGNDFDPETGFSRIRTTNDIPTNGLPTMDQVNNVERLVLPPPLSSNYVITVVGYRVNVNARRDSPTNVVQDFALAFSSDVDASDTNTVGVLQAGPAFNPISIAYVRPAVGTITNSVPLLNERAGENSPLVGGTNGSFKQWRFYVFTNSPGESTYLDVTNVNGSNVVFLTFPVGNLSRSRTNGPDVDLYVSRDPRLLDLNPEAVANADKSTSRGGSELLAFLGEPVSVNNVFYVGVKSEDHEAGEYGFIGFSTDQSPFDGEGNPQPFAIPLGRAIPDGTPDHPGIETYLAVNITRDPIRAVIATVTKSHENFPDLISELRFNQQKVVLQNHTRLQSLIGGTNVTVNYDDTGAGRADTIPADGPGSMIDFLGYTGVGPWFLNTVDNALGNTGSVDDFSLTLLLNDFGDDFVRRCVNGGFIDLEVIIVPPEASRLTVTIRNIEPPVPLEVFIKRDAIPDIFDPANNDKYAQIPSSGGSVSLGVRDVPPLQAGRYFIAVLNPSAAYVCFDIRGRIERNLDASFTRTFETEDLGVIPDAARRFASLTVDDPRPVTAMDVGLRVDHPRVSDLSIRLQNPRGYSAVVFEDRGGEATSGLGNTVISTNLRYQHVALSFEPGSHRASLYVNGSVVAEQVLPPDFRPVTSNQFFFGYDPQFQFRNQQVQLDDFGIWRRALRPQEVRDIYQNGLGGEPKQASDRNTGLMALWPFNVINALNRTPDLLGPNAAAVTHQVQLVPGAFPNESALLVPTPGFGIVTNDLQMPRVGEFTIEGWVAIPDRSTNAVIAGWWGDSTGGRFGPGIVSQGALGVGSLSGVLTDQAGRQVLLTSAPGVMNPGKLVTNYVFATFSENTNRSFEKIKFVPPPFTGQVFGEQLLSVDTFDAIPATNYPAGESFRGWSVLSNSVAVVQDSLIASSGLNFLAVSNGVVRRSFDAVVGERYKISFLARLHPEDTNTFETAVLVDGVAVTPPPVQAVADAWTTNSYDIRATRATVTLDFVGLTTPTNSPGLLVDDVAFLQTKGSVTYLPEEPVNSLMGAGQGIWTLELEDTREPYEGELLGWELTLTFAPATIPAIRLTNGIPYSTNVASGDSVYFYIDVPLEASTATNLLRSLDGSPLALWYNPTGVPGNGTLPDDTRLIFPTTGTNFLFSVLTTNLPPLLVPGQRYYLSVENLDTAAAHPFTVEVDLGVQITPLTNGIPLAATNANNGLFQYYSYNVSSNALGVSFILTNLAGNVNLVARRAPQLPTQTQFDYASTNTGVTVEQIDIDVASQPVRLTPGTWYLGVYAADPGVAPSTPIPYTILAVESMGRVIPLTNGIPTAGLLTNQFSEAYFVLDITNVPISGSFVVTNMTEDVSLYLHRELPLPSPTLYDYASTNAGTATEEILLTATSLPVPLSPGRWFVTVVSEVEGSVTFDVIGSYISTTATIIPLTNAIPYAAIDSPGTNSAYFSFEVPRDTPALLFEIYSLTGDATLRASRGTLPAFADPTNIFSFPQPGSLSERVSVRTNQVPDLAGLWYLEVAVESTNAINFTVQAATQSGGLLISTAPFQGTYVPGDPPQLVFDTIPGEKYRISFADDLKVPLALWTAIEIPPGSGTTVATAPGDVLTVELPPAPADNVQRYYRIEQVPQ
ncbi:MAG: S8 family serine peptidase [Verrucomicrobiales bacterium]|nr:S8 family serine peptidase [Verrucomicrobiales bacterium]